MSKNNESESTDAEDGDQVPIIFWLILKVVFYLGF